MLDLNLQETIYTSQLTIGKKIFSDETRYSIFNSDGKKHVRCPFNTRFNPKYVPPTVKHGKSSVFLWGCFPWNGVGFLHVINETTNRFDDKSILQNDMLTYAEWEMLLQFVFQQDNDPKHALQIVQEWFQENNVKFYSGQRQT